MTPHIAERQGGLICQTIMYQKLIIPIKDTQSHVTSCPGLPGINGFLQVDKRMSLQSNNLQTPVKDLFFNFDQKLFKEVEQWAGFRKETIFWKNSCQSMIIKPLILILNSLGGRCMMHISIIQLIPHVHLIFL